MARLRVNLGLAVLLTTVIVVLLFGSVNFYWVRLETGGALATELEKRGSHMAQSLAAQSVDAVLLEDRLVLNRLVDGTVALDETVAYVFLIGPRGELMAHTFAGGFPQELLRANVLPPGRPFMVRRIVGKGGTEEPVRDVVAPIAEGYAGFAHVGLKEDLIMAGVRRVERAVAGMVAAFVLLGIVASLLFTKVVTKPLERLALATREVNLEMLRGPNVSRMAVPARNSSPLRVETEVDRLAGEFRQMVERLSTAYRQLGETHQRLVFAERLSTIGTIAAGLAHELSNPLAGLRNCVRRIQQEPGNRRQLERYLAAMQESAERMQRVLRGLLDLARPRKPAMRMVEIEHLFDRVLLLIGHRLTESRTALRREIHPDASLVWGDEQQLEQALLNLALNACDSLEFRGDQGGRFSPQLMLSATCENGRLHIEVRDNGIGIESEDLPRLFDPFFSTKPPGRGTGLGLSIAQDIVSVHSGDLVVESQPGAGASFRMVLPISEGSTG